MKISIIGAGLGGLSTACLLAAKGHQVSVYEKNSNAGGKMNIQENGDYRFDTGPSLLTMPFILEQLFEVCGANLEHYVELIPLNPVCKYFYRNGTIFNNYEDTSATLKEIERIAPEDLVAYSDFLKYTEALYQKTADAFIFNPLYNFKDLKELSIPSFLGIDAFTTVSKRVDQKFNSQYLRKFFKRFTTYNGSSPFLAPATLNVIPHVEINMGGYYVKGGLYKIIEAIFKLAESLGVNFFFNSEIGKIITKNNTATGIQLANGEILYSDLVVSNSDATETINRLIPDSAISSRKKLRVKTIEPSCSGFVLMLGIRHKYDQLEHHNIYFSENYKKEFHEIFEQKIMPDDPTIYIANTSYTDPTHAPAGGSNLFILVNAPYLSNKYDWNEQEKKYGDKVIRELEKRGLNGLSSHIQFQKSITPKDFYVKYLSNKGSIYGTSSNTRFSAFLRPRNKSREIDRLYFTGGSTHPGGGIPLVIQSAFNAVNLIDRYE
ncbi:MAG: phytoene desaturase family protein [Balneolaceae bacterium]